MLESVGSSAARVNTSAHNGLPGARGVAKFPPSAPSPSRPSSMSLDCHPLRRVTAALALALVPLAAACAMDEGTAVWGRGEAVGQLVLERATRADSATRLDLRDLAPFRWDSLIVLAPGTPADSVRRALPAPLPGAERIGAMVADTLTLFVFTTGADVLAATLLPRTRMDVDAAATGRRYGPDGAAFRVEPVAEGRWRLVGTP